MQMQKELDIFSLGLLWFQMATGRPYWQSHFNTSHDPDDKPDLSAIAMALHNAANINNNSQGGQHQSSSMTLDHDDGAGDMIDPAFKELIAQCLQVDPAQRPTVNQLLRHPFVAAYAWVSEWVSFRQK